MEPQIRKIISQQNAASGLQITLSGVKEIVRARALVREMTKRIGFTMVNQARFVTAVSEIARAQFERFDCVVLQIFDEGNTKWHRISVVFEAEASELERFKRLLLFEGVSGGGGIPRGVENLVTEIRAFTEQGKAYIEIVMVKLHDDV